MKDEIKICSSVTQSNEPLRPSSWTKEELSRRRMALILGCWYDGCSGVSTYNQTGRMNLLTFSLLVSHTGLIENSSGLKSARTFKRLTSLAQKTSAAPSSVVS